MSESKQIPVLAMRHVMPDTRGGDNPGIDEIAKKSLSWHLMPKIVRGLYVKDIEDAIREQYKAEDITDVQAYLRDPNLSRGESEKRLDIYNEHIDRLNKEMEDKLLKSGNRFTIAASPLNRAQETAREVADILKGVNLLSPIDETHDFATSSGLHDQEQMPQDFSSASDMLIHIIDSTTPKIDNLETIDGLILVSHKPQIVELGRLATGNIVPSLGYTVMLPMDIEIPKSNR